MIPYRIDIINGVSGVSFEDAWQERVAGEIDRLAVNFLSLPLFKRNKMAAGRAKDLADLEALDD